MQHKYTKTGHNRTEGNLDNNELTSAGNEQTGERRRNKKNRLQKEFLLFTFLLTGLVIKFQMVFQSQG